MNRNPLLLPATQSPRSPARELEQRGGNGETAGKFPWPKEAVDGCAAACTGNPTTCFDICYAMYEAMRALGWRPGNEIPSTAQRPVDVLTQAGRRFRISERDAVRALTTPSVFQDVVRRVADPSTRAKDDESFESCHARCVIAGGSSGDCDKKCAGKKKKLEMPDIPEPSPDIVNQLGQLTGLRTQAEIGAFLRQAVATARPVTAAQARSIQLPRTGTGPVSFLYERTSDDPRDDGDYCIVVCFPKKGGGWDCWEACIDISPTPLWEQPPPGQDSRIPATPATPRPARPIVPSLPARPSLPGRAPTPSLPGRSPTPAATSGYPTRPSPGPAPARPSGTSGTFARGGSGGIGPSVVPMVSGGARGMVMRNGVTDCEAGALVKCRQQHCTVTQVPGGSPSWNCENKAAVQKCIKEYMSDTCPAELDVAPSGATRLAQSTPSTRSIPPAPGETYPGDCNNSDYNVAARDCDEFCPGGNPNDTGCDYTDYNTCILRYLSDTVGCGIPDQPAPQPDPRLYGFRPQAPQRPPSQVPMRPVVPSRRPAVTLPGRAPTPSLPGRSPAPAATSGYPTRPSPGPAPARPSGTSGTFARGGSGGIGPSVVPMVSGGARGGMVMRNPIYASAGYGIPFTATVQGPTYPWGQSPGRGQPPVAGVGYGGASPNTMGNAKSPTSIDMLGMGLMMNPTMRASVPFPAASQALAQPTGAGKAKVCDDVTGSCIRLFVKTTGKLPTNEQLLICVRGTQAKCDELRGDKPKAAPVPPAPTEVELACISNCNAKYRNDAGKRDACLDGCRGASSQSANVIRRRRRRTPKTLLQRLLGG